MTMKAIIAKVNGPQDMANLDPRDMVGRISVGDQDIATVFTIYISCGSHDFKEVFPIISTTRVPIQLALKLNAAFPFTYGCLT